MKGKARGGLYLLRSLQYFIAFCLSLFLFSPLFRASHGTGNQKGLNQASKRREGLDFCRAGPRFSSALYSVFREPVRQRKFEAVSGGLSLVGLKPSHFWPQKHANKPKLWTEKISKLFIFPILAWSDPESIPGAAKQEHPQKLNGSHGHRSNIG